MSKIVNRARLQKAGGKKNEVLLTKKYIEEAFEDECVLVLVSMTGAFTGRHPAIQAFANGTTEKEIKKYIKDWKRSDQIVEILSIMDTTGKSYGDLSEFLSLAVNSNFTDFLDMYLEAYTDNNKRREAHASELFGQIEDKKKIM